jgi:hypothetical protein
VHMYVFSRKSGRTLRATKAACAKSLVLIGLLFILAAGLACENAKKRTAEAAVNLADQAWAALGPDAKMLAPEEFRSLQDSLSAAHDALNKGDYDAALAAAKDLPRKVKDLNSAIRAKKDEFTARWKQLNDTVPEVMAAVQTRIDGLRKAHHHLPHGAADGLADAQQTWNASTVAFQAGQFANAFSKASEAQSKLADLQKLLGMKRS